MISQRGRYALESSGGEKLAVYSQQDILSNDEFSTDFHMQLMNLVRLLKMGSEETIVVANELFESIRSQSTVFADQLYFGFLLVSFVQSFVRKNEIPFPPERAAQILNHTSLNTVRDDFCDALEGMLEYSIKEKLQTQDDLASRLLATAESRFNDPDFTLGSLAEGNGLTDYAASRLFQDAAGISFKKYIKEKRLEQAYQLLETTDLSIAEITQQCGFSSPSYFSKVFHSETNMSPKDYRKQKQQNDEI